MYAENTTGNLFVNSEDQQAYVLVSGRWFRGPSSLKGPWAYVASDQLPKDFAAIPEESAKENVKASIRGTDQAEEAVVANSIPQTAQVKRSDAKFAPVYDGEPQLAPIEGTAMQHVRNASNPVILVDNVLRREGRRLVRLEQPQRPMARGDDGAAGDLLDSGRARRFTT